MKRKLTFIVIAALTLAALIAPVSAPAAAGQVSALDQARLAAQSFMQNSTAVFPDWKEAILGQAQAYCDLQGGVNAYMFSIQKVGATIGRITVGSAAYSFRVIEAGSTLPPSLPPLADVAASLDNDLGIKADMAAIGMPRLTYLGYDSYFASYTVAGNSVALDLRSGQAYRTGDLTSLMTPAAEYQALRASRAPRPASMSVQLPVPVRNMSLPGYQNNCGPTAGAEIDEYYKLYRFYSSFDDWHVDHDDLYVAMQTNGSFWYNGTLPWNWGPGFVSYAAQKGYAFSTFWVQSPMYTDFSSVQYYINSSEPPAVLFWGPPLKGTPYPAKYKWHYVAVRGYQTDDYGDEYLIVNDGWGGIDTVSWDINYGGLSLHFVYPS